MVPIPYSELTDLEEIGQGGFGVVYLAKHALFGTVVYKELDVRRLGDRYSKIAVVYRGDCECGSGDPENGGPNRRDGNANELVLHLLFLSPAIWSDIFRFCIFQIFLFCNP